MKYEHDNDARELLKQSNDFMIVEIQICDIHNVANELRIIK